MRRAVLCFTLLLLSPVAAPAAVEDPNTRPATPPRRPLGFKVFNNMDQPVTGVWELEIPELASRRVQIEEAAPGNPNALRGVDAVTGEEVLRLTRKKEGIGFTGQLLRLLSPCGFDTLAINDFLPLGDAAVLKFELTPPAAPCAPIDSGRAGRLYVFSRKGGPVKLRDLADISAPGVRETYSIGGDRPNTEASLELTSGGVSVDDGSELRLLRRVKAPLDSTFWFEVEAVVSPGAGAVAPRGYLRADSLRFVGSLSLRRLR